jgi:hypothetical protein
VLKSCCVIALLAALACGGGHEAEVARAQPPAMGGSISGGSNAASAGGWPSVGGGSVAGAGGGADAASGNGGGATSGGFAGGAGELGDTWVLDNLLAIGGLTPEIWGAPSVTETPHGKALCFDGDDGIVLTTNPLEGSQAFTLQVLFRPDPVLETETALAEPRFVHIETDAADRATVEARVTATQFYLDTFIASAGQSKTLVDPARVHPVGEWHWAALTYASGVMRHYVDGTEDASADLDAVPFGPGKTSIGVRQNHLYWFKGCVRELRFVARALTTETLEQ